MQGEVGGAAVHADIEAFSDARGVHKSWYIEFKSK